MHSRARRVDINQPDIVKQAKEDGWTVTHTYTLGQGIPDIFVSQCFKLSEYGVRSQSAKPRGCRMPLTKMKVWVFFFVEIKQPGEKLTEPEVKWHALNKGCVEIVHSPAEFRRVAKKRVAQCLPANTPSS